MLIDVEAVSWGLSSVGDLSPFVASGMDSWSLKLPCSFSVLFPLYLHPKLTVQSTSLLVLIPMKEVVFFPLVVMAIATTTIEFSFHPKHGSISAQQINQFIPDACVGATPLHPDRGITFQMEATLSRFAFGMPPN